MFAARRGKKQMELTESADLNFLSGQNVSLYAIFKYVKNIVIESPKVTTIYLGNQYANRKKKKVLYWKADSSEVEIQLLLVRRQRCINTDL